MSPDIAAERNLRHLREPRHARVMYGNVEGSFVLDLWQGDVIRLL